MRHILYQVEDGDPVAHGREKVGAIWTEEQVALAVDGAQQVGELDHALVSITTGSQLVAGSKQYLEAGLHCRRRLKSPVPSACKS